MQGRVADEEGWSTANFTHITGFLGLLLQLHSLWSVFFITPLLLPLRKRTVEKRYLALAVGVPAAAAFSVDAPIDRDNRDK